MSTGADTGAEAGDASVHIVGSLSAEDAERAQQKRAAAVEFQARVLASADEALDRAQGKLAKLEARYSEDIEGAKQGLEEARASRQQAIDDYEAALASTGEES